MACSPLSHRKMQRTLHREEKKLQNHIGFIAYDPAKDKTILEFRSDHYFTPASNTKVLTLFSCLKLLKDSIPSIRYIENADSLIFWGLGDASFLNPECFDNQRTYNFLRSSSKPLYLSMKNFHTQHFGRGWAWDDYGDDYSVERSAFPIYGNVFSFFPFPDRTVIVPAYFKKFYNKGRPLPKAALKREVFSNQFTYHPGLNQRYSDFKVPFHVDTKLVIDLLQDTLKRKIGVVDKTPDLRSAILFSVPADSLYAVMMKESDNDIAEQLLLSCSAMLSDSLAPEIPIRHIQQNFFSRFRDRPIWVDGSGLSRYNLLTPRFMLEVWKEIYRTVPRERLFRILAVGGQPGTLKRFFSSKTPYLFGKTGTLSNNHSLSGFLVTKSGKTLIFSFMNANYVARTEEVRKDMERILNLYYEHY
jgi:serine-type D-Ala-D-Ala carboxypeptidase/endopeptidase (penicillin-binding protein 4)